MKNAKSITSDSQLEDRAFETENLRFDLMESEREVEQLKDYIFGLKMLVVLLAGFMVFWFIFDIVFRALGWLKSL